MNGDVLTICQTYEQNGDLMYDPRIDLKVDYDNKKVIPLSLKTAVWEFMRNTVPN